MTVVTHQDAICDFLRENEAAGQLELIHQLEAGLRKQQQIIEAKDEVYNKIINGNLKWGIHGVALHPLFPEQIEI